MTEQKKISQLQKGILIAAFARGGNLQVETARQLLYKPTRNEKAEQSRATSISRATTRLVTRGLAARHFAGQITLTRSGVVLAAQLALNQKGQ